MDAAAVSAVGVIAVGLATAAGALIGKRGETRVGATGQVLTSWQALFDQVQEERDKAHVKLAETERLLVEAYADLTRERADKAGLSAQISQLNTEKQQLLRRITELGGLPP